VLARFATDVGQRRGVLECNVASNHLGPTDANERAIE
jgi:hypothetical protein